MLISEIGIETEYFLHDKNNIIIPPHTWERDDFPLLGEIRGKKGNTPAKVMSNFWQEQAKIYERLSKDQTISIGTKSIPLSLYQKANRETNFNTKRQNISNIKNIYGTDIIQFSDQIISKNKIQAVNVSCGLHIHFSCSESITLQHEELLYTPIDLPLILNTENSPIDLTLKLYKQEKKDNVKIEKTATVSRLCKPAIEFIVKAMDSTFFEQSFSSAKEIRTKYRQPGFYELKPYGFEYRSLPANKLTMTNKTLERIVQKAFELLKTINSF